MRCFIVVLLLFASTAIAAAQDQRLVYTELFESTVPSSILNGSLGFEPGEEWEIDLDGSALTLRNRFQSNAVRTYTLEKVLFEGMTRPMSTGQSDVRATVSSEGEPALVGVFIGKPLSGNYMAFTVGPDGNYLVADKSSGRLTALVSGDNPAIKPGEANELFVERKDGNFEFHVNGALMVSVPAGRLRNDPVGVVAIGSGEFRYEEFGLTSDPRITVAEEPRRPRFVPTYSSCDFPAAPAGAEVFLIGTYEGQFISPIAIAGQGETATSVILTIEPGETPLYLIATSYDPMIWQLRGATDRVARFVGLAREPELPATVGVTGIPQSKFTGVADSDCFPPFHDRDRVSEGASRAVEAALGIVPKLVTTYEAAEITLPSATVRELTRDEAPVAPPGFEPQSWTTAVRFSPGGVADLDLSDVVTDADAARYEVLPDQFGLSQLTAMGVLEYLTHDYYRIVKPVPAYPAGLGGAHSVVFQLAAGVPYTPGEIGHSVMFDEDTGLPVLGDGDDEGRALERLCRRIPFINRDVRPVLANCPVP